MTSNDLDLFNDWMTSLVRARVGDGPKISTHDFQREFVGNQVNKICNLLSLERFLLSVRSLHHHNINFLRPVRSEPPYLHSHFSDPKKQEPFHYNNDPFADADLRLEPTGFGNVDTTGPDSGPRNLIGGIYRVSRIPEKTAAAIPDTFSFPVRISQFVANLKKDLCPEMEAEIEQLGTPDAWCLALGVDIAASADGAARRFEHFLAMYFVPQHGAYPDDLKGIFDNDEFLKVARSLFHGLELIRTIDSSLFATEGLRLVSDITARFAHPDIAPADKMSFLIEKLKLLLADHMIGTDPDLNEDPPTVYYVATQFARPRDSGRTFRPSFQIYPLCYSQSEAPDGTLHEAAPVRSLLESHRSVPSIAKFLTMQYFERRNITADDPEQLKAAIPTQAQLHVDFTKLFADPRKERVYQQADALEHPDQLFLSSLQNEQVWDWLGPPDLPGEPKRKAAVAFVIEGGLAKPSDTDTPSHGFLSLPRGILLVESSAPDAFSRSDIKSLRSVVAGAAPLIRNIAHSNASIDYEYAIRTTFQGDVQGYIPGTAKLPAVQMSDILFQMMRIDAEEFERILEFSCVRERSGAVSENEAAERQLWLSQVELTASELAGIAEAHKGILIGKADQAVLDEAQESATHHFHKRTPTSENRALRERRQLFMERMEQIREAYKKIDALKVYNFMAACPPNYVWSGYLRSISHALGDRAVSTDPRFRRIGPGFSADAIFMAAVDGELRQIVKLSTWEKLYTERRKYREFVRYKVPFAARIPATAYAIESRGYRGLNAAKNGNASLPVDYTPGPPDYDTFGALVSDLVDGKTEGGAPQSIAFLDLVAQHLLRDHQLNRTVVPSRKKLLDALQDHFFVSISLWRKLTDNQKIAWRASLGLSDPTPQLHSAIVRKAFRLEEFDVEPQSRISRSIERLREQDQRTLYDILKGLHSWLHSIQEKQPHHIMQFGGVDDSNCRLSYIVERIQKLIEEPTAGFKIGTPDLDSIQAIVHGDLNARNLAWAGAFKRFFLIDFEHVDYGFQGIDQFRLVMSLTADMWTACMERLPSKSGGLRTKYEKVGDAIEQALILIDKFTDAMTDKRFSTKEAYEEKGPGLRKEAQAQFFARAIATILSTIANRPRSSDDVRFEDLEDAGPDWWRFMAFAASAKEFEYSLRDMDKKMATSLSQAFLGLPPSEPLRPATILTALQLQPELTPDQKRICARFIVSFCCLVASLPSPTEDAV